MDRGSKAGRGVIDSWNGMFDLLRHYGRWLETPLTLIPLDLVSIFVPDALPSAFDFGSAMLGDVIP